MAVPLIGAGIGAIGSIGAGKAQADAAKEAAQLQSQSAANALAFTKQQYGDLQGRLQPYIQSGQTANTAMAALLARSPYMQAIRAQMRPPTSAPMLASPRPNLPPQAVLPQGY